MIRPLILVALLCFSGLSSAQVTNGKSSGMSAAQIARVRKSKYRVLVPTYLPTGFRLVSCGMSPEKEPVLATWLAKYRNQKTKAEFIIQMASDGIGDPPLSLPDGEIVEPTGWTTAQNPILGKIDIVYYQKGKDRLANCTWYETKSKSFPKYAMLMSEGIPVSDAKRILQSLRWLK